MRIRNCVFLLSNINFWSVSSREISQLFWASTQWAPVHTWILSELWMVLFGCYHSVCLEFVFTWSSIWLCSPGWSELHRVAQASLNWWFSTSSLLNLRIRVICYDTGSCVLLGVFCFMSALLSYDAEDLNLEPHPYRSSVLPLCYRLVPPQTFFPFALFNLECSH